jgi:uncharacterized membrane-anchored protein YitT (DUF2179 family)
MTATKRILATLVGFVTYFLLGWVLYGMALSGYMESQTTAAGLAVNRPEESMIWWAMIVSNIFLAYFLVYIFGKWANISTFMGGLQAGMTLGLIIAIAMDLMFYSMADMMTMTGYIVDILVTTVMWGITGGVIGWFLGRK